MLILNEVESLSNNENDRELWNRRYRSRDHPRHDEPAELLIDCIDWLPDGRALDVATGTGRHALFLAEHDYEVDAIDISDKGLDIARETAAERNLDVNWIHADLDSIHIRHAVYDVVCVIGYYDLNLIPELKEALVPGGILLYQHHLGPAQIADRGPSSDRFRFRSNDLLRSCLDLTVLMYREQSWVYGNGNNSEIDPKAALVARNGLDGEPWYPPKR